MGIHNLKGEIQMDVLPGRKLEDLRTYAQQHPAFLLLTPKAVIMDLAQAYHTWISECFPCALRIADRFHVSPNYVVARLGFTRWCEQVEQMNHGAVRRTLGTMRNWEEEIVNYHHCRWTNAAVEGQHNRIKTFQRRHYFTRNHYKTGILVKCNPFDSREELSRTDFKVEP
ncbi:MAG TPA: transposase [Paenibacillus sp.]|jgi:transposase